jgi:hypothetical protein
MVFTVPGNGLNTVIFLFISWIVSTFQVFFDLKSEKIRTAHVPASKTKIRLPVVTRNTTFSASNIFYLLLVG